MKILHVCQNYYPSKGGPQYTLKHLSEKLHAYYHDDVTVCTSDSMYNPESALYKKISPVVENINGVKIHRMPFRRWHYPLIKYGNKAVIKLTGKPLADDIVNKRWDIHSPAINRMMRTTDADVIMGTTINYDFCNYPLWRHKLVNAKPFVMYGSVHLHIEYDFDDYIIRKARICDCYIANTDFEREVLINKYGAQPHKIITAGTGIDTSDFVSDEKEITDFKMQHGIAETDVIFGFVGRLVKGKGVAVLIDAIRRLSAEQANIKLLLAGASTDYVPAIKDAINKEKLPIILIENFSDQQKKLIYHAMDIFVLPSQSESFGVVFLEAWACRKAVIGGEMGATASLLQDGVDSLLVNINEVDDLVNKITLLAKDEQLRNKLGAQGYQKALTKFSWPSIVSKYRDAYLTGIENFKLAGKNIVQLG